MITDARVLKDEFIPREVVHRDQEIDAVSRGLEPVVDGGDPENTVLYGPSGAGKTCIARYVVQRLEEHRLDLASMYVNCWENYNRFRVLYKALEGLGKTLDIHRQSTPKDELLSRLRRSDDQPYIVILDEADQLEDASVLYDLYAIPYITLMLIANREEDVFARMDDRVRSRLMSARRVRFDPYGTAALTSILADRAEWGLHPDAVTRDQLSRIAERADGDARVAIGALRAAAREAEAQGLDALTQEIIAEAVPAAAQETRQKNVERLNEHQRVLYDIVEEAGNIAPRQLYERYEEEVDRPKSERTLRTYLRKMVQYDMIAAAGEKRGRVYRSC